MADKNDKFTLIKKGDFFSIVVVGSETVLLNHSDKEMDNKMAPNGKLPVASQEVLKKVYDSGPQYQKWIKPPDNHEAPWKENG